MNNISSSYKKYVATLENLLTANSIASEDAVRKISLMHGSVLIGVFFLSLLGTFSLIQGALLVAALDFLVALFLAILFFLLRIRKYLYFCFSILLSAAVLPETVSYGVTSYPYSLFSCSAPKRALTFQPVIFCFTVLQ